MEEGCRDAEQTNTACLHPCSVRRTPSTYTSILNRRSRLIGNARSEEIWESVVFYNLAAEDMKYRRQRPQRLRFVGSPVLLVNYLIVLDFHGNLDATILFALSP